jgi:hypothetical protein
MTEPHPCQVRIFYGDGEYDFRIPFAQLEELQDKLGQGPMRTLMNFESGEWSPKSVYETVRLGLIGGGMEPAKAYTHAKRYCLDRPMGESVLVAVTVLSAALMGVPKAPESLNG